jgi:hypothetical protein
LYPAQMRLLKRTPLVSLLLVLVGALAALPMSAAVTISVDRTRRTAPTGTRFPSQEGNS